jgi:hypothetical protein
VLLRARVELAEDPLPLEVEQFRGVQPSALLRVEGDVRPGMVAVCGEVQPPGFGAEGP